MDQAKIKKILKNVRNGSLPVEEAYSLLKHLPYHEMGYAKLDSHRAMRKGFPEVVYCQGKSIPHVKGIIKELSRIHSSIMATRADEKVYSAVRSVVPRARYNKTARIITIGKGEKGKGKVLIVTAGTADIPVAEEAAVTSEFLGSKVDRLYDVGVAGLHRIINKIKKLNEADVIIVIAGMEGALASVVGGLTEKPVIAVPTSIGYGASFKGLAALLSMLNSCAPGVAVVNIDNGFGAGVMASIINRGSK